MWIGRRWHNTRSWFANRPRLSKVVLGIALLTSPYWCCFGSLWVGVRSFELYRYWFDFTPEDRAYWRRKHVGYANSGLPSVGRQLKAEMEAVPDPDTALQLHPEWAAQRFKNGEWVIWRSIASMGPYFAVGSGTAVIKDSRGRVRIYFGFVKFDNEPLSSGWESLKECDEILAHHWSLREWIPE